MQRARRSRWLGAGFALALLVAIAMACSAFRRATNVLVPGVHRPVVRDVTPERVSGLRTLPGFSVRIFAELGENPRMMAVGDDGRVYVTRPDAGDVIELTDADGDGRAERRRTALSGLEAVHGITIHDGFMYLAAPKTLWQVPRAGAGWATPRVIANDLPEAGRHANRTLAFGPDGRLYLSVGSSCNACREENPEHATILRFAQDLRSREVFARGLRNTIGFDWHPDSRELWGMDHGSDWRGDDLPPEELNRIVQGGHYGWPYAFGKRQVDPEMGDPPGTTKRAFAERTIPAVALHQAHSAPIDMLFYTGSAFQPSIAATRSPRCTARGIATLPPAIRWRASCSTVPSQRASKTSSRAG